LEELGLGSEGTRQALLIGRLRQEYVSSHDNVSPGIVAGTEQLPEEWVNKRLRELGHRWWVRNTKNGFAILS
jgi:hypothetical protein